MKYVEQKSFVSQLKDAAIITAAGVTVVGTILWFKRETAMQQLTEEAGAEQMRIRTALERLAAAVERVEGHLQDLATANSSKESLDETTTAHSSNAAPERMATADANGTATAEENKSAPVRRSRKTGASKSGTGGQKTKQSRTSRATNGDNSSSETQTDEPSAANHASGEAA